MGGNGSIVIAARNPDKYKSFSAFAPICNPTSKNSTFATEAFSRYFTNNPTAAENFDSSIQVRKASNLPNGLIDFGTHDEYIKGLEPQTLIDAIGEAGHKNVSLRW